MRGSCSAFSGDDTCPLAYSRAIGARMAAVRPAATMILADMMVEEMRFELEVTAFRG